MRFKEWYEANEDMILEAWAEKIACMQDSAEHIHYVANSDKCFQEFAEEMFEDTP